MLSPVEIINVDEASAANGQTAAVILLSIPRSEISKAMDSAIPEIMQTLQEQSITIQGPLFSHYFTGSSDVFDFEVGVATNEPVKATGRVYASTAPFSIKVAKTTYTGSYDGLHVAWATFYDCLKEKATNGVPKGDNNWEVYVVGPDTTDDLEQWKTELFIPIE